MADGDFESAAKDIGGAVSALFGAKGATASAGSYAEAAAIALQSAEIAKQATGVKEIQASRQINRTLGTQAAGVGGAGFAMKGTALDLLRSSASEGALTKALIAEQGMITENSYAQQAGLYSGLAGTAKSSATGQSIGGILQGAGGALSLAKAVPNLFPSGTNVGTAGSVDAGALEGAGNIDFSTGLPFAADVGAADAIIGAGATDWVAGTAIEAGADFALGDLAAVAAWVVCTELRRQGRMPARTYYLAAPEFASYSERGKRGYWIWAIPSTRHLRAHPLSWYSRLLCATFNCRARYIADRKRGRPTTMVGALVTHGLFAACWLISWFVSESGARWQALYKGAR